MRLHRKLLPVIALAVPAACSSSSDNSTGPGRVASSITIELDTLDYGATVTPGIVVKDRNGSPMTGDPSGHLTIESSDTTVATVNMDDMSITGTGVGEATITVRYDDVETEEVLAVRLGHAPAERLAVGAYHSCVLSTFSTVQYCWGRNNQGQIGNGSTIVAFSTPRAVQGYHSFSSITAGYSHTCAIENGDAWCWGYGGNGALGYGGDSSSNVPVKVSGGLKFVQVSAGDAHTCGLAEDGTAHCWGSNNSGVLGTGSSDPSENALEPKPVATTVKFVQIAAAGQRTCALTRLGKMYCWGRAWAGSLGTGDETDQTAPVAVVDSLTFVRLVGGYNHSCGMDREGRVFCWGYNGDGELGNNSTEYPVYSPVQVQTSARFSTVSYGQLDHLCGIDRTDASLYCWGYNNAGQLGNGTIEKGLVPVRVPSFHAKEVAGGFYHTCAISIDDDVFCWGRNAYGQIGNNGPSGDDVLSPALVSGYEAVAVYRASSR
ncbi:MAG TPA: hypothetical protein VFR95_04875 [Gemmatimonadaceae bacterium]|nr:hypothetical protein [Gemmatimonadaceae bacterium]